MSKAFESHTLEAFQAYTLEGTTLIREALYNLERRLERQRAALAYAYDRLPCVCIPADIETGHTAGCMRGVVLDIMAGVRDEKGEPT